MRFTRLVPHILALALALGALAPLAVFAHADYERSNPPEDAVIPEAPERLDVWFAEEVQKVEGANSLTVTDANGTRVDTGDLVIDDDDRTHMSIGLQPDLPDGVYTVVWVTTSDADGDTDDGDFVFTVDASAPAPTDTPSATASPTPTPATPTATPTAGASDDSDDDGSGVALPLLIVLVLAGVGAFLALTVLRRRRG